VPFSFPPSRDEKPAEADPRSLRSARYYARKWRKVPLPRGRAREKNATVVADNARGRSDSKT